MEQLTIQESEKINFNKVTLRSCQIELNRKFKELIEKGETKGFFVFPTGLGKSFGAFSCGLNFIEDYEKRTGKKAKILILVHTEDLIRQHEKDFKELCNNRSIGLLYKAQKDLIQDVIIANVRTFKNYLKKFKEDEFVFVIVDETHHVTAKTWKDILVYLKPLFLLGMTATPDRSDEDDIKPIYNNNKILEYTKEECFQKGWLRPYDLITLWDKWCDYGDINGYYGRDGMFKYNSRMVGKKYIVPERIQGIINYMKNGCETSLKKPNGEEYWFKGIDNRKTIYFLPRVDAVKRYCAEFNKAGLKSEYIIGKTSPEKRIQIFKDFEEGKIQFIFNVDTIKEGMHPNGVDLVVMDRPTDSKICWTQGIGRQLLNIEGETYKRKGLVIDLVGNSKNSFRKHLTKNSEGKRTGKIHEMIENEIGVPCFFQGEVIDYFNKEIAKKEYNLKEAIEEYKRIYNKKPTRNQLKMENNWLYQHFLKNQLLDKYCLKSCHIPLNETIEEFKKIYGDKKPARWQLGKENYKIYHSFFKNQLLDKYCSPPIRKSLDKVIIDFKKIYGNKKPTRYQLIKENNYIYQHFQNNKKLLDKYCYKKNYKLIAITKFNKFYGNKKPTRTQLQKENSDIYAQFLKYSLVDKYCLSHRYNVLKIPPFIPKIIIPKQPIEHKGKKDFKYTGQLGYEHKATKEEKDEIRPKIVSKISNNYRVIALESPEGSFVDEIVKQGIKPLKLTIPNNREPDKLVDALKIKGWKERSRKNGIVELTKENSFPITVINTDAQTWLANTDEKYDFLWLDYCGAFSYYAKDLDIIFGKHFGDMKLILTYNLFDPAKDDENYYFTRVIDYVLEKSGKAKVRLLNDITYRYKKNMYNLGFDIMEKQ